MNRGGDGGGEHGGEAGSDEGEGEDVDLLAPYLDAIRAVDCGAAAGPYTRPLFGSTYAHFVGYVGCMVFPLSIRQRDTGRCDQSGLG
jgi:hypothetical protein